MNAIISLIRSEKRLKVQKQTKNSRNNNNNINNYQHSYYYQQQQQQQQQQPFPPHHPGLAVAASLGSSSCLALHTFFASTDLIWLDCPAGHPLDCPAGHLLQ